MTEKKMPSKDVFNRSSIKFDFFLYLYNSDFDRLVEEIVEPFLDGRRAKLSSKKRAKWVYSHKILLMNFLAAYKREGVECLAVPKTAEDIIQDKRYGLHQLISKDYFLEAYKNLKETSYIVELAKGQERVLSSNGRYVGRRTRARATEKLTDLFDKIFTGSVFFERHPDEEVIILREQKPIKGRAKEIEYDDNNHTNEMRKSLRKINEVLEANWYDLDMDQEELEELRIRMKRKAEEQSDSYDISDSPFINRCNSRLKRIFNNSDFEQGGRFYGGWWQAIPSEYRKRIMIDNKYTCEVDFSNMHPLMLYDLKEIAYEGDAYQMQGLTRKHVKVIFNMLLNKSSDSQPRDFDASEYGGVSWNAYVDAIRKAHKPIKEYFGSGEGLRLQNIDARIAEKVLQRFANINQPCLPLHDSFIVHHALLDELKDAMLLAYKELISDYNGELKSNNNLEAYWERSILKDYTKRISDDFISSDIEDCLNDPILMRYTQYKAYEVQRRD